jgi:succinate dehydrogenase/fumarate reductase-like Fe-S protein
MKSGQQKRVKIRIRKCSPLEGKQEEYVTYEIPLQAGWSVTNVLKYINETLDGGLAHYISCRRGVCGECVVRMDGRPKLACMEIVTGDVTLEPVSEERVIKDLVCFPVKKGT